MSALRIFTRELPPLSQPVTEPDAEQPTETVAKGGSFGGRYVSVTSQPAALAISAFHRAVELRARTMSQLVVQYQTMGGGGNFTEFRYGAGRRLNYMLQVSPNPLMSASVMMLQAEIDIIMRGNAFIYIDRDSDGEISALWLANQGFYDQTRDIYSLDYNGLGRLIHVDAPSQDVIHIPNTFRAQGGFLGIPTLVYAARALGLAATNDAQALENAAKGGKMKLLVQEKDAPSFGMGVGRAAQSELKKITEQLNEDVYAKDVVLLNNVASATPISQSAQQMELLESRKFSVPEIARYMGVPTIYLMDASNSTYKTPEAANQEFYTRTIQPKIREWENELDRKLLGPGDFGKRRFHVCELPLFRLDPEKQGKLDKIKLETGVNSVNELRKQYDQPAIPDGDHYYVSTNLAEVGSEKLRMSGGGRPKEEPVEEQTKEGGES